jgi:hypothetical protein
MTSASLSARLVNEVDRLRSAQAELEKQSREFPEAERIYRIHEAWALLQVDGRNEAERKARAEFIEYEGRVLSDSRFARDIVRGAKDSADSAVRNQRQIISAIQTEMASERSEAELLRFAPQEAVGA